MSYVIKVAHDPSNALYYILSSELPGLNVEATTFEALVEIAKDAATDLVEHHGDVTLTFELDVELAL